MVHFRLTLVYTYGSILAGLACCARAISAQRSSRIGTAAPEWPPVHGHIALLSHCHFVFRYFLPSTALIGPCLQTNAVGVLATEGSPTTAQHQPSQEYTQPVPSDAQANAVIEDINTADWEITPDELTLAAVLGEGEFGIVYKGKWNGTPVAIKVHAPLCQQPVAAYSHVVLGLAVPCQQPASQRSSACLMWQVTQALCLGRT